MEVRGAPGDHQSQITFGSFQVSGIDNVYSHTPVREKIRIILCEENVRRFY